MPEKKYYYNPKTLRFERKKISPIKILSSSLGYLSFGVIFFVGLLALQNRVVESPLEKALRTENREMKKHKLIVSAQLEEANQQLATLQAKDSELYKKIFEIPQTDDAESGDGKEEILAASSPVFNQWTQKINERFMAVASKSEKSNNFFRLTTGVGQSDVRKLQSTPVLQPLENFDVEQLVSGYGVRINPFHKGRYHHDGADLAAPRGAHVVAAGPGKVVVVKRSDLLAGFGNYVEVDHGHGYVTRYAHLEEITVRAGEKVLKGFKLGTVGISGGAIAPHVHYEVMLNGRTVDPLQYLVQGLDSDQYTRLFIASKTVNQSLD